MHVYVHLDMYVDIGVGMYGCSSVKKYVHAHPYMIIDLCMCIPVGVSLCESMCIHVYMYTPLGS